MYTVINTRKNLISNERIFRINFKMRDNILINRKIFFLYTGQKLDKFIYGFVIQQVSSDLI